MAKRKVPSSRRKMTAMTKAMRSALRKTHELTKKAEEAKARAHLKVFAAKLIAHIAKEAGIKGPPAAVKKKVAARARAKVTAARKKAKKSAAAARARARRNIEARMRTAGMS